jgi:hypothetical protein
VVYLGGVDAPTRPFDPKEAAMQPADLIPAPDAIPVGWGWFQVLLTVTFVLHVVFMNLMLGGTIIALFNSLKGGAGNLATARYASQKLPFSVALAVNAGVAPLLFLQVLYGHFVYASSILMAVAWLSIVLLLIIAYYGMYLFNYKFESWGGARSLLAGGAALIMLYIAFIFTNNWTLSVSPEKWGAYFASPGGTLWNLDEPTLWPRYLHMVLGAVAVAGLGLAGFGKFRQGRGQDASTMIDQGMNWFKWTTLIQMAIGIWWLIALREDVMKLFMGGNLVATIAFGAGFLLAIVSLLLGFLKKVWPAVWATVATLLTMAVMREYVRYGYLKEHFTPSQLEVDPQFSPLVFFLAVFVVGMGCVWYMLKLAAGASGNAGKEV